MFNFFKPKEFISTPKNEVSGPLSESEELLRRGEYVPIRASLIDINNIDKETQVTLQELQKNSVNIDYYASRPYYKKNRMKNNGKQTYAISQCDEKSKYSTNYYDCTGIILVGKQKNGEKQLSFMTHQDPSEFLSDSKEAFEQDLTTQIQEFYDKIEAATVDAIIMGGNFNEIGKSDNEYIESIDLLSRIIQNTTGKEPNVITGPNQHINETNAYFDTQRRRLYICRPFQDNNIGNKDYMPSALGEQSERWEWDVLGEDDNNNNNNNNNNNYNNH